MIQDLKIADHVPPVSEATFQREVLEHAGPVLAFFSANWCFSCGYMALILRDIGKERGDTLKLVSVDMDTQQKIASQYNIKGFPAFVLFNKAAEIARQVKTPEKAELLEWVDAALSQPRPS